MVLHRKLLGLQNVSYKNFTVTGTEGTQYVRISELSNRGDIQKTYLRNNGQSFHKQGDS